MLSAASAFAQAGTGTITGRVQNAVNGNYLNNARVSVVGTDNVTFTNQFGEYMLTGVAAGDVQLRVVFTGLDERIISVSVPADSVAVQDIRLTSADRYGSVDTDSDIIELDDFVIAATRDTDGSSIANNEQRFSANIKSVVDSNAFGNVTEGNVGEFIKYLPGVSVDYVAADVRTISVRGLADNFTPVSVDGAQMASAASSSNTRAFELEQVSMNNVSRIEVSKVPLPSVSARSLGGSVNMVSKSAFERDRPEFSYKAYLSISDENTRLFSKTPGPHNKETYKALPGFEVGYANPLTDNLGIVVNVLSSNQFNEQHRFQPTWRSRSLVSGQTTVAIDPYLRNVQIQDGPKNTFRDSISLKVDWKPAEGHVVSASWQSNYYKSVFGNRNLSWNVGTTSTPSTTGGRSLAYDTDYTYGALGRGSVTMGTSFRDKLGATNAGNLSWRFKGRNLELDAGLNYSKSKNWYRDHANGHFDQVSATLQGVSYVTFDNIRSDGPPTMKAYSSTGVEVDPFKLSNYRLANSNTALNSRHYDSYDKILGARFNARYAFGLSFPLAVQGGLSYSKQDRDIVRQNNQYRYYGADHTNNSADDTAAPFLDTSYIGQDPGWGVQNIEWFDPYLIYDRFVSNPDQFVFAANTAAINRINNSYFLREEVSAAYVQVETRLFDNRMNLLAGVRYEKTEDFGLGALWDRDTGVRTERGAKADTSYDGFYPSVHMTFNITDDLMLRAAYAQSYGPPNLSNVLPSVEINEDENWSPDGSIYYRGYLNIRNSNLKPYEGRSYDLTLEYYTRSGGMFGASVFRKEIDGIFESIRRDVTAADLEPFGLGDEYLEDPWEWRSTQNGGDVAIEGVELSMNQKLGFLGPIGKMFNISANVTDQKISGSGEQSFERWVPRTANFAVSFDKSPFSVKLKWNYRDKMRRGISTSGDLPGYVSTDPDSRGFSGMDSQTFFDVDADYKFSKKMSFFISGRNVLDHGHVATLYNAYTPDYAQLNRIEKFAVQWAIGVRGRF